MQTLDWKKVRQMRKVDERVLPPEQPSKAGSERSQIRSGHFNESGFSGLIGVHDQIRQKTVGCGPNIISGAADVITEAHAPGQIGANSAAAVKGLTVALNDADSKSPRTAVEIRKQAAYYLGRLGPAARSAVPALSRCVNSPGSWNRPEAAIALWRINQDTNVSPVLARELDLATSVPICIKLAQDLGEMGRAGQAAIPALLRLATDPARQSGAGPAWAALFRIDPDAEHAISAWTQLLSDSRSYARQNAAIALWRLTGNTNAISLLVEELEHAPTPESAAFIIQALGRIGPSAKAAIPSIQETLTVQWPVEKSSTCGSTKYSRSKLAQIIREALMRIDTE